MRVIARSLGLSRQRVYVIMKNLEKVKERKKRVLDPQGDQKILAGIKEIVGNLYRTPEKY